MTYGTDQFCSHNIIEIHLKIKYLLMVIKAHTYIKYLTTNSVTSTIIIKNKIFLLNFTLSHKFILVHEKR